MGNGMNKVLPGLYVGSYRDSKDISQLDRYGITHVVAIHDSPKRFHPNLHYLVSYQMLLVGERKLKPASFTDDHGIRYSGPKFNAIFSHL